MHRLLLSLQAKRMIVLQLLLLSLQNNVDARGCTKEPGYFASGDSIQGYAGISMKHADDCAIKCAGVLGCVGWTFNHQKENRELGNKCWLVKTDENTGDNFDWVRGLPCKKDPTTTTTTTTATTTTIATSTTITTVDPIKDETLVDPRQRPEEPATEEEAKTGLSETAVLALLGGLAVILLSCLTVFFCWCGCCLQKSCSSNSGGGGGGEDPSTEREWNVGGVGRRELTSERWSPPLEHKQSFREESDKSFGSVFYEDADVYR